MSYKNHTVDNGGDVAGYDPAPAIPTGIAVGDFLVAIIQTSNTSGNAPTPPAGWTLQESADMPVETGATSSSGIWIYTREADQGDVDDVGTSPYTWTFANVVNTGVMVLCDPAEWGEWAFTIHGSAVASAVCPSVTTTVPDELAFFVANRDAGYAFTVFPSGDATMVNEFQGNTNGAGSGLGIVRQEYATTQATGTKAFTVDPSDEATACSFTLRPTAVATREQDSYRMEDDDGSESGSTFLENQNVALTRGKEDPFRIRVGNQYGGGADPAAEAPTLHYKESADPASEWRPVP